MRYWLTTHYPHYPSEQYDPLFEVWNIFVPRRHRDALEAVAVGDKVAFYVVGRGPRILGKPSRPKGEQAIVCIAQCKGAVERCPLNERYTNGRTGDYAWQVACGDRSFGKLDRSVVCDIVGWKSNYSLRGLGRGSGLRELTPAQFAEIEEEFSQARG